MSTTRVLSSNRKLEIYRGQRALSDPAVRASWESLLALGNPLNRVFASPELFQNHCQMVPDFENHVALIRGGDGAILGVCPIVQWKLTSPLQIRRWTFARIKFNAATVCGGEPLFPQDPALFRELFDGLIAGLPWCDCI